MSKRPSKNTAAPAPAGHDQANGGSSRDPREILMHWQVARERLAAVAPLVATANTALLSLPAEATDADRKKAEDALATARASVDEVIADILALPDMPSTSELATLFVEPANDAEAEDIDIEAVQPLAVDADLHRASLKLARIRGPRGGRWRRGHHFTDEEQTLLISRESFEQLQADPALSVNLVDDD